MAIEGRYFTWTIPAGEDMDDMRPGTGHLFKAVALDDGRIAQNGREAGGILLYGGKREEHVTLAYAGIIRFVAGEDIGRGERLTVRSEGYFCVAKTGEYVVGRCLDALVEKYRIGTGMFNFATASVQL